MAQVMQIMGFGSCVSTNDYAALSANGAICKERWNWHEDHHHFGGFAMASRTRRCNRTRMLGMILIASPSTSRGITIRDL